MSIQAPLVKLIGLLILLPLTATYLHLYCYTFWQYEYCLVGPASSSVLRYQMDSVDNQIRGDNNAQLDDMSTLYGIYAPVPYKKKKGDAALDRRSFRQKYSPSASANGFTSASSGWPSVTQGVMMISAPSSTLSKYSFAFENQNSAKNNRRHEILFIESGDRSSWCLQSGNDQWCSQPIQNQSKETIYQYPNSGLWLHSSIESKQPILISCPTPSTKVPSKKSKHQKQNGRQNQNVKFLLQHPTTALLLVLNIGLAYQYWNHRVSPASVSKSYKKICLEHEWWRSFTGATAHFEPLHIGFNMMSLHTLGKELEGGFGSIVFLMYNIALIVMCTFVMMGIVYARLCWVRYEGRNDELEQRLIETSTVGYSGVLFALMVITTLERNQATCPIPFFSDVCFATHHVPGLPWLRFNIAPIVSLFVAQFIMPRVSFVGHLAGIACGFGLHWGWGFPPLEVCSPNVLIGAVYLVGCLIISRKVIPIRSSSNDYMNISRESAGLHLESSENLDNAMNGQAETSSSVDVSGTDPFMRSKKRKKEREMEEVLRKKQTLLTVRNLIGVTTCVSVFLFDATSSIVLSQIVILAYFAFGTSSSVIVWTHTHVTKVETEVIESEKDRAGVIWRGYIVAVVISFIVDSMSIASWLVLNSLILAESSPRVGLITACLLMVARMLTNGIGLIISSKILFDFGQVGSGIFTRVFPFLSSAKQVGDEICAIYSPSPSWSPFEGRGVRLGSLRTP